MPSDQSLILHWCHQPRTEKCPACPNSMTTKTATLRFHRVTAGPLRHSGSGATDRSASGTEVRKVPALDLARSSRGAKCHAQRERYCRPDADDRKQSHDYHGDEIRADA